MRRLRAAAATTEDRAEYKQVTVLFADVVRSMDLASTWSRNDFAKS